MPMSYGVYRASPKDSAAAIGWMTSHKKFHSGARCGVGVFTSESIRDREGREGKGRGTPQLLKCFFFFFHEAIVFFCGKRHGNVAAFNFYLILPDRVIDFDVTRWGHYSLLRHDMQASGRCNYLYNIVRNVSTVHLRPRNKPQITNLNTDPFIPFRQGYKPRSQIGVNILFVIFEARHFGVAFDSDFSIP